MSIYAFIGNDGVSWWDVLGLNPGDDFATYKAAYEDAVEYNRNKGRESLKKGWRELEKLTGLNSKNVISHKLPATYKDLVMRAYKSNKGILSTGHSTDDMAIYVLEVTKMGKKFYSDWVFVIGREKGSSIFCYDDSGSKKFSYNFTEGKLVPKSDVKKDEHLTGRLYDAEKLISQKKHKGKKIVKHIHLVHTHIVERFDMGTYSNFPKPLNNSIGRLSELSKSDIKWSTKRKMGITAVAEDQKNDKAN